MRKISLKTIKARLDLIIKMLNPHGCAHHCDVTRQPEDENEECEIAALYPGRYGVTRFENGELLNTDDEHATAATLVKLDCYARKILDAHYSVEMEQWGDTERLWVYRREDMSKHGEAGIWVHCVNPDIHKGIVEFVKEFMQLDGEVCASIPGEDLSLYSVREHFLSIVMEGPAIAVWDADIGSDLDWLGRRTLTEYQGSRDRHEAWIVPAQQRLVSVATDVQEWIAPLRKADIPVVVSTKRGLEADAQVAQWFEQLSEDEQYSVYWEWIGEKHAPGQVYGRKDQYIWNPRKKP